MVGLKGHIDARAWVAVQGLDAVVKRSRRLVGKEFEEEYERI
jgi:hypothetical protein